MPDDSSEDRPRRIKKPAEPTSKDSDDTTSDEVTVPSPYNRKEEAPASTPFDQDVALSSQKKKDASPSTPPPDEEPKPSSLQKTKSIHSLPSEEARQLSDSPQQKEDTINPSSDDPDPAWHNSTRDWEIFSIMPFSFIIIFVILIRHFDLHEQIAAMVFFVPFLVFIGVISGYFFYRTIKMEDYKARFFFYRWKTEKFIEILRQRIIDDMDCEPEDIESISGHTFGLFKPMATWKLSSDQLVEVNEFKGPISSVIYAAPMSSSLGIYLLVKAPEGSKIWPILNDLILKKDRRD